MRLPIRSPRGNLLVAIVATATTLLAVALIAYALISTWGYALGNTEAVVLYLAFATGCALILLIAALRNLRSPRG